MCHSLRCAGAGAGHILGVWVGRIAGPLWWCSAVERSGPVPCFPPALTLLWMTVSLAKTGRKPFPSFAGWAFLARGAETAPSAVYEHWSWCRGELGRCFSQTGESFWLAAAAQKLVLTLPGGSCMGSERSQPCHRYWPVTGHTWSGHVGERGAQAQACCYFFTMSTVLALSGQL